MVWRSDSRQGTLGPLLHDVFRKVKIKTLHGPKSMMDRSIALLRMRTALGCKGRRHQSNRLNLEDVPMVKQHPLMKVQPMDTVQLRPMGGSRRIWTRSSPLRRYGPKCPGQATYCPGLEQRTVLLLKRYARQGLNLRIVLCFRVFVADMIATSTIGYLVQFLVARYSIHKQLQNEWSSKTWSMERTLGRC